MARARFLGQQLTADLIRFRAGDRSFGRGQKYKEAGLVDGLKQSGDRITATVHGTSDYEVKIRATANGLSFSCTCPVGEDGEFCKHCVALGLEWIELDQADAVESDDELRSYLSGLTAESLIELVLEEAAQNPGFNRKLSIRAAGATKNPSELNKLIDRVMKSRVFVDYARMPAYARAAGEVINQIEDVLARGDAGSVVEFSERALKAAELTLDKCDDSDGYMSGILARLQDVHLSACEALMPDPISLARRLYEWELRSDWDVFDQAAATYRDVLGVRGLGEYRRLAEETWSTLPPLRAGDKDCQDSSRFRITRIMEALAIAADDLEELAEIQKKDLSKPYAYLKLAQLHVRMGRSDTAIEWAQRGIEEFERQVDERLHSFLADLLEEKGDDYGSMQVAWKLFSAEPSFRRYPALKERAERLDQWDRWRPQAFAAMRAAIEGRNQTKGANYYRFDHSDLVSVHLWEGNVEAAWAEAREGGCSNHLMLQVAERRAAAHPEDSVRIYKMHVDNRVAAANNGAYDDAAACVERIGKLEPPEKFAAYIELLRIQHKAKRNFMKRLDVIRI